MEISGQNEQTGSGFSGWTASFRLAVFTLLSRGTVAGGSFTRMLFFIKTGKILAVVRLAFRPCAMAVCCSLFGLLWKTNNELICL